MIGIQRQFIQMSKHAPIWQVTYESNHFGCGFLSNLIFCPRNVIFCKNRCSRIQIINFLIFSAHYCSSLFLFILHCFRHFLLLFLCGSFVIMDYVDYSVKLASVRNNFYGEFPSIFVHVFNYFILLNHNGVEDVLQVFFFVVQMTQRKSKTVGSKNVPTVSTNLWVVVLGL